MYASAASGIEVPVVARTRHLRGRLESCGVVVFLVGMRMMLCRLDRLLTIHDGSIKAEYAPRYLAFPYSYSSIDQNHFLINRIL
jgi:hypothetical protein